MSLSDITGPRITNTARSHQREARVANPPLSPTGMLRVVAIATPGIIIETPWEARPDITPQPGDAALITESDAGQTWCVAWWPQTGGIQQDFTGDIGSLRADVGVLQGNVGTLQGDVGGLLARLADADPVGRVEHVALKSVPAGWLLCDGQVVTTAYPALRDALIADSSPWGSSSGNPKVPNLIEQFIRGYITTDNVGGGKDTVQLSVTEMPSHTHIQDAHNHTQNSHNHTQNAHGHSVVVNTQGGWAHTGGFGVPTLAPNQPGGTAMSGYVAASAVATNQAATATNNPTTATNQNTGGGAAHENRPPFKGLMPIIRAY